MPGPQHKRSRVSRAVDRHVKRDFAPIAGGDPHSARLCARALAASNPDTIDRRQPEVTVLRTRRSLWAKKRTSAKPAHAVPLNGAIQ